MVVMSNAVLYFSFVPYGSSVFIGESRCWLHMYALGAISCRLLFRSLFLPVCKLMFACVSPAYLGISQDESTKYYIAGGFQALAACLCMISTGKKSLAAFD